MFEFSKDTLLSAKDEIKESGEVVLLETNFYEILIDELLKDDLESFTFSDSDVDNIHGFKNKSERYSFKIRKNIERYRNGESIFFTFCATNKLEKDAYGVCSEYDILRIEIYDDGYFADSYIDLNNLKLFRDIYDEFKKGSIKRKRGN